MSEVITASIRIDERGITIVPSGTIERYQALVTLIRGTESWCPDPIGWAMDQVKAEREMNADREVAHSELLHAIRRDAMNVSRSVDQCEITYTDRSGVLHTIKVLP